jgi:hypothetical protein
VTVSKNKSEINHGMALLLSSASLHRPSLKLPSYDFCTLLEPEMATAFTEAKAKAKAKKVAIAA